MTGLTNITVLVVDDQPAARSLMKKMLKEMQVGQVFEAASGGEAASLIESAPEMVDVVVCDWNMPGMSGVDLVRRIGAAGIAVPIIMTTGRADKTSVLEAKAAGVAGYLAKPFSLTQLEAKIRVAVTRRTAA